MKAINNFTDLTEYFKMYGEPHTNHYYEMHKEFMEKIRVFFKRNIISINEGRHKKDKIKIHLHEINNFDLNASALKLDERAYAVIIRSGVFEIIHNEIGQNFEIFDEITKSYYEDLGETMGLYYMFIYVYLIGHELGHIMRGHHFIIDSSEISESVSIFDINNNKNVHPIYDRYYLELDADLYAVSFLIKFIHELKYKNLIAEHMEDKDNAMYNPIEALIKLAITSIYIIHNLFAKKHSYNSEYPEPHTRTSFMVDHLKRNLGKVIDEKEEFVTQICESQMKNIYELQKEHYLSAFKISSFDEFNKNTFDIMKKHLEFYGKFEEYNFKV